MNGPDWFQKAVGNKPGRLFVPIEGIDIEVLVWGQVGRPGLLLLHGNAAHADWWRFIAPFFADTHRVAAISWSGMGRSGWRDSYSIDLHVREALNGASAAGLFASSIAPVFVGHSFGAAPLLQLASDHGHRLSRAVIVDNGARPASDILEPRVRTHPNPVYPDRMAAIARYRLVPPAAHAPAFLEHFLAETSLREVDGGGGWTWAFDPFANRTRGFAHIPRATGIISAAACPLTFIRGAESALMTTEMLDLSCRVAPSGSYGLEVPGAGHHVMIDQPLAFIAALRSILAVRP